jgi:hypothetical protein
MRELPKPVDEQSFTRLAAILGVHPSAPTQRTFGFLQFPSLGRRDRIALSALLTATELAAHKMG